MLRLHGTVSFRSLSVVSFPATRVPPFVNEHHCSSMGLTYLNNRGSEEDSSVVTQNPSTLPDSRFYRRGRISLEPLPSQRTLRPKGLFDVSIAVTNHTHIFCIAFVVPVRSHWSGPDASRPSGFALSSEPSSRAWMACGIRVN